MSTSQSISDPQLQSNIVRAVAEVFQTMLELPAELVTAAPPIEAGAFTATLLVAQVVGSVGFSGQANGILYLCFEAAYGTRLTGKILGMSPAEVAEMGDDLVNDAIGELTNMVAGSFKNALCDAGFPCMLTVPSLLRGINFCVQPWPAHSVRRLTYHFQSRGDRIVADLLMKTAAEPLSNPKIHVPENSHHRRLPNCSTTS